MNNSKSTDFKPIVVLIDLQALHSVQRIKEQLEKTVGHSIKPMDFVEWVELLCMEACVGDVGCEIQVLMLSDKDSTDIDIVVPSNLKQLDGMATQTKSGEIQFAWMSTEGMTSIDSMLLDTLQILLKLNSIQHLLVVSSNVKAWDSINAVIEDRKHGEPDGGQHIPDIMLFEFVKDGESGTSGIRRTNVGQSMAIALGL